MQELTNKSENTQILIGTATCGRSAGAMEIWKILEDKIKEHNMDADLLESGCIGLCYAEPLVIINKPQKPGVCFAKVNKETIKDMIDYILSDKTDPSNILGTINGKINDLPDIFETPFLKHQVRRVLRNCGFIDPTDINAYLSKKGYSGLKKALTLSPTTVLEEIKNSGLRGRGGAGFPTGKKWEFCINTESEQKYLICNADEGDPGAFMNRSLIEGDPHSLIEGMLIAAHTIGADKAFIYCRTEYPLALKRLKQAIIQATEKNLLGKNILNSGFSCEITIKEGAGAFVCGEETALIASIEGKRGMPKPRPPFPAVAGLWGKPTIINNVETLASVAMIITNSADWYKEHGTQNSPGTKTFSLVGKVKNTGLIEVPLGTPLRKIIYEIGGGPTGKFKAVQTGGPSGGCIPENLIDTPVDYEELAKVGSIMGSGGLVVMDDENSMVEVARYFLEFATLESCGECVPCRLGTKQLLDIVTDIKNGKGTKKDLEILEDLAKSVKMASLCGLGQTAPNPILTTLNHFRHEYEELLKND